MAGGDLLRPCHVGNRASDATDSIEPPCAKPQTFGRRAEEPQARAVHWQCRVSCDADSRPLTVDSPGAPRCCCLSRAATTRARMAADDSAPPPTPSNSGGRRLTSTVRSSRSRSGPDRRPTYCATCCGVQRHSRTPSPAKPHGHGFMAATRTKRAGKVAVRAAREMLTTPSSSGCRKASSAPRENSSVSSRKSTPLCARLTSPGRGCEPPPTSAAVDAV